MDVFGYCIWHVVTQQFVKMELIIYHHQQVAFHVVNKDIKCFCNISFLDIAEINMIAIVRV